MGPSKKFGQFFQPEYVFEKDRDKLHSFRAKRLDYNPHLKDLDRRLTEAQKTYLVNDKGQVREIAAVMNSTFGTPILLLHMKIFSLLHVLASDLETRELIWILFSVVHVNILYKLAYGGADILRVRRRNAFKTSSRRRKDFSQQDQG